MELIQDNLLKALATVIEPEMGKDVVALSLVSNIEIKEGEVSFTIKVKNPTMHNRKRMQEAGEFAVERFFGKEVKATVAIEILPAEEKKPEPVLPNVKNIVAIASGKGGVGKSTVTANLAIALVQKGYKVGLVDADVYGPSMPIMFDCVNEKPNGIQEDGKNLLLPVEAHGVKLLSIGFFADPSQAIVWRGSMASKAIKQMFLDAKWGELDYLLIDLPPGTGDVHLTIVQSVPLTGAVVVSTPQDIAVADARKGAAMFQLDSVNVPVLGIIENMAYFTPAELPDNKYYIFGKDGAKNLASDLKIPLLAELPLVQSVREAGDAGRPAVLQGDTPIAEAFNALADKFVAEVENRNANLAPTEKVEITHS